VILLFAVFGFFPAMLGYQYGALLKLLMGLICLLLIMHGFATMNVVKAIPSWNHSTVVPLSIVSGIWVGSQVIEFMMGVSGREVLGMEVWCRMILLAYIGLIALYLWGTFHASEAARYSVSNLVRGGFSRLFYSGVVLIGIVVPLLITLGMWGVGVYSAGVFIRLIFVLTGDLALRYSIMKSAYYTPLL
jgi:formate-dependent nitrite reductase membrane component NrfD